MGNIKIKIRRGTQAYVEAYTTPLNEGEPVWMTDNHRILICDGTNTKRHDLLNDDVTDLGKGKFYGKIANNVGFQDFNYDLILRPEEFFLPTDSAVTLGSAFSLINSVDFDDTCTISDMSYVTMSPTTFNRLNVDTNFKVGYTLTGDNTDDREIELNCYVWQLKRGEVPYSVSPNFTYSDTIVSKAATNIDRFAEFNFSNFKSDYVGTDATGQIELIVIGISRNATTDSYTGTFKIIELGAYYSKGATEYGYNIGGYTDSNAVSTIDRIKFPFNTGSAINCNNLASAVKQLSSCNSSTHGFIMGGIDDADAVLYSTIDKFEFPFNDGVVSNVGNLADYSFRKSAGLNSSSYGYNVGGVVDTGSTAAKIIDRFDLSYDTAGASDVGNLSGTNSTMSACNSSTYGFVFGGSLGSTTDRITFPFNSGTATVKGNVSASSTNSASFNCSQYGYCVGGGSTQISTVYRITFPFDSGNATGVSSISVAKQTSGCNSTLYGYIMGGESAASKVSTIESLLFPFEPATSSTVEGNLSDEITQGTSIDGVDFVTMFV